MTISVIIPTYRRPQDLCRCLKALEVQTRLADEIIVIVRDSDTETLTFFANPALTLKGLQIVNVTVPGQVSALNAGLDAAQGEIIAITDDDTAPHSDWLERIETHFASDPQVGGVGGRDWVYQEGKCDTRTAETVGKLQFFGRTIGNHHLGVGAPREVDILKGANMSYRRKSLAGIRFDERLRGTGAQVHNDLAFSVSVKEQGWKLIYDPQVAIDHFPAERFDEDHRQLFNAKAVENMAFNETLVIFEHLSLFNRLIYIIYSFIVGVRYLPGIFQMPRLVASGDKNAFSRYKVTVVGRISSLLFLRRKCKI